MDAEQGPHAFETAPAAKTKVKTKRKSKKTVVSDGMLQIRGEPAQSERDNSQCSTSASSNRGTIRQTDFEGFLTDQLHALKLQLLAYHKRQTVQVHEIAPVEICPRISVKLVGEEGHEEQTAANKINSVSHLKTFHRVSSYASASSGLQIRRMRTTTVMPRHFSELTGRDHVGSEQVWTRFAITKGNVLRRVWSQGIIVFCILYVATLLPYKLAFLDFRIGGDEPESLLWYIIQRVVDVCFWLDLILSFFMSYTNNEDVEVCDIRLIAKRYLTGMFLVDFLACLPSEIIFKVIFDDPSTKSSPSKTIMLSKLQRLARLLRLFRLSQLVKLQHLAVFQKIVRFRGLRMVNLAVGVVWVVHLLGAGWYLCGALHGNAESESWVARRTLPDTTTLVGQPPEVQWVHSMYFVLTVFTTVGFGDMYANTPGEIAYVCMLMMVGGVINGMVLSSVMSILEELDRKEMARIRTANTLRDFADHTQLSPQVTHTMVEYATQSRVGTDVDHVSVKEIFSGLVLPRDVLAELSEKVFKGKLLRHDFLEKVRSFRQIDAFPPRLPICLATMLKVREFEEKEIVYRAGDVPVNLFLVTSGIFAFVDVPTGWTDDDVSPYQLFGPKAFFGAYEVLNAEECRLCTARCETSCTALLLQKSALFELCDDFPTFSETLKVLEHRREGSRQRRLGRLVVPRTYETLACESVARWIHRYTKHKESELRKRNQNILY
eukprot:TRINITY_DN18511_c0_g2_i1.p1 TRINITY_DN18511_c0_g2~~TRINITY_DN18511_c0_g2_i1.p1  ORF type:complete len:718 (+),score=99.17 TRINITY_DN18511_c0_g2_i1:67-2220(+)